MSKSLFPNVLFKHEKQLTDVELQNHVEHVFVAKEKRRSFAVTEFAQIPTLDLNRIYSSLTQGATNEHETMLRTVIEDELLKRTD